jgi:hypothetical protein
MNKTIQVLVVILVGLSSRGLHAQDITALELGVGIHGVIGIGDQPLESYTPNTSVALVARYNLPYRLAIRGSFAPTYTYAPQRAPESELGWDVYKSTRAALGLEYHFSDFNIYDARRQFTSYAMIGGTYQFGNFEPQRSWNLISKVRLGAMGSVGVKLRAFPFMVVSAELAAGYLFSDDYDRDSTSVATRTDSYYDRSGNDWYLFPNLTITYTFGPKF